jgi:trans-aconitate 2-methyltransferase
MAWDPDRYGAFRRERMQPARDLLERVELSEAQCIYDLGCGPGGVTRLIAERWPAAAVTGIDNSPEMLARAGAARSSITWQEQSIADFAPGAPATLIFSNAALNWLGDHGTLLPGFVRHLAPGGILAVQMPRNSGTPSQHAMADAARAGPWASRLAALCGSEPVAEPAFYYRALRPYVAEIEIWQTEYVHVLEGDNPVVEWMIGTALRPFLAALDEGQRAPFLADYSDRVRAAYPPQPDGRTLFSMRRLFILARAPGSERLRP